MTGSASIPPAARWLGFLGALLCACAVALAAYASHAATVGQAALMIAAAVAFGHGLALAALSRQLRRRAAIVALYAMAVGTLLFSGALVASQLAGLPPRTAPFGGTLLIASWLTLAVGALRN